MIGFCILFSFGVAYIAYRGVTGTTGVNIAINIIQITALLIFSVIALGYRSQPRRRVGRLHARPRRQADSSRIGQRARRKAASRTRRRASTRWNKRTGTTSR